MQTSPAPVMSFTLTPYGVLARIPVYDVNGRLYADLSWCSRVPAGESASERERGLLLALSPRAHPQLPNVLLYDIGACPDTTGRILRVFSKPKSGLLIPPTSDGIGLPGGSTPWREIYLAHYEEQPKGTFFLNLDHNSPYPIRFPEDHMNKFMTTHGLIASGTGSSGNRDRNDFEDLNIWFLYPGTIRREVLLQVGQCRAGGQPASATRGRSREIAPPGPYWANIQVLEEGDDWRHFRDLHKCPQDHIQTWPQMRKHFSSTHHRRNWDEEWLFTLGFAPCPEDPKADFMLTELSCEELIHLHK